MRKFYQKIAEKLCKINQELLWHSIAGYLVTEISFKICTLLFGIFWLDWFLSVTIGLIIIYAKELWDDSQPNDFFDKVDLKYGLYGIIISALLALI